MCWKIKEVKEGNKRKENYLMGSLIINNSFVSVYCLKFVSI